MKTTPHASSPLVSIIIPTYNRAHIIETAVESALGQTYENIEVIVVDDGSSDDTEHVLKTRFPDDARLRYYKHTPNRGGNYARNRGLDLARGEYVTFLDSDDTYLPTKVEKQVAAAQTLDPTRPHVVQCQIVPVINEIPQSVTQTRGKRQDELAADYLFLNNGQSLMPLLLLSTDHARNIRFNEDLPKLQDADWFIRVFDHNPDYAFVSEGLATYVLNHGDSQVSHKIPPYDVMSAWVHRLGKRLSPRSLAVLEANFLALYAIHSGERLSSIKYLANGIRHDVVSRKQLVALSARIVLPRSVHQRMTPLVRQIRTYNRNRRKS